MFFVVQVTKCATIKLIAATRITNANSLAMTSMRAM